MSKTIQVVFVHGSSMFSDIIEKVEQLGEDIHGDNGVDFLPTHCGLIVDGMFQEALASGFIGNNIREYKPPNVRIYNLTVTNEDDIKRGDARFKELLGQKYSIQACINGGFYTIFNMIKPETQGENDCSGDETDVLRAYGIDINNKDSDGNNVPASSITPNILIGIIDKIGTLEAS